MQFHCDEAIWLRCRVTEATEQAAQQLQKEKIEADAAEAALQQQVSQ